VTLKSTLLRYQLSPVGVVSPCDPICVPLSLRFPTYPPVFYVPHFVADVHHMKVGPNHWPIVRLVRNVSCASEWVHRRRSCVKAIASFRSKRRVPALTWTCSETGVSLVRCAQPMVGASGERCGADESLIDSIRWRDLRNSATRHQNFHGGFGFGASTMSGVVLPDLRSRGSSTGAMDRGQNRMNAAARDYSHSMMTEGLPPSTTTGGVSAPELHKVLLVDCRPRANAMANMAKGGGTESTKNYRDTELIYLKIDNIHGMAFRSVRRVTRGVTNLFFLWLYNQECGRPTRTCAICSTPNKGFRGTGFEELMMRIG